MDKNEGVGRIRYPARAVDAPIRAIAQPPAGPSREIPGMYRAEGNKLEINVPVSNHAVWVILDWWFEDEEP